MTQPAPLTYHLGTEEDLDLLADWNHQLIQDEGHRNPMSTAQLGERMRVWIKDEYQAAIFTIDQRPAAYALYRETPSEIYLRQFFVRRERRREGIGRVAFTMLRNQIWPNHKRLTVEVLTANPTAVAFWRAMGYRNYSLLLEILPSDHRPEDV